MSNIIVFKDLGSIFIVVKSHGYIWTSSEVVSGGHTTRIVHHHLFYELHFTRHSQWTSSYRAVWMQWDGGLLVVELVSVRQFQLHRCTYIWQLEACNCHLNGGVHVLVTYVPHLRVVSTNTYPVPVVRSSPLAIANQSTVAS